MSNEQGAVTIREKFLSTNFVLNFGLMLAGVFAISADVVTQGVALVGGIIGFTGIARTALKGAKFDVRKFADPNVYSYAFAALAAVLPIVGDLTPYLGRLIDAVAIKDWGAVGSAVIALAVTIFKLQEKPRGAAAAE